MKIDLSIWFFPRTIGGDAKRGDSNKDASVCTFWNVEPLGNDRFILTNQTPVEFKINDPGTFTGVAGFNSVGEKIVEGDFGSTYAAGVGDAIRLLPGDIKLEIVRNVKAISESAHVTTMADDALFEVKRESIPSAAMPVKKRRRAEKYEPSDPNAI